MFQPPKSKPVETKAHPRVFAVALVLVLVVTAGVLLSIQRYSESQYGLALSTDELGLAAYDLSAAASRVAVTHRPLPPGAPPAIANDIPSQRAQARLVLARSLTRFNTVAAGTEDVPLLQQVEHFSETVRQLQIAVQDQNIPAVAGLSSQADEEFAPLTQNIRDASQIYADHASRAQTAALFGRLLVFLSAAVIIAAMYWRYRSVQRKVEAAEAEQEELRHSEARFRPLVQSSSDIIAVVNADNTVTYVSPAVERITGLTPEQVIGRNVLELLSENERRDFGAFLLAVRRRPRKVASGELEFASPDGPRHLELVASNRLDDEDVRGLVLNIRDVTERKALEQQLRFQAFHDPLTGLANSTLFADRLEQALNRTRRTSRGEVSVLYLDLDHFKEVNDDMGHQAGDDLLREVGARLLASIRSTDTAARLGGDEFAILIDDVNGSSKAQDVADRIVAAMAQPFDVQERDVRISASIGVVVADVDEMSAGDVLRNADLAMYDAKHHGRNRVHHFQPAMLLALADLDAIAAEASPRRKAAA